MQSFSESNTVFSAISTSQTHNDTQAGQPDDHDSDCFPVIGLFPRTNLPDPEVPDIAAMSDGDRRLWMAPRRDPVADQLPQARQTLDRYPPGDPGDPAPNTNGPPVLASPDRPPSQWPPAGATDSGAGRVTSCYGSVTSPPCSSF